MKDEKFAKEISDINESLTDWYTDVCKKAKLVDYGPCKGTMIMREYGYAIWELIQKDLDRRIKETGHNNVYFPLFIPYSYFKKEAEHVEGFAPELAAITEFRGEKLDDPMVVRPTSETVICEAFSRWVNSYKDLPVKINQWANVVRMEKTTRPFLRTTEFLWQEGHTLHRTKEEADEEAYKMWNVYIDFCRESLALPLLAGKKSESEKFAGAEYTLTIESIMRDGKSLQSGTSHNFGQKFAKAFDIKFLDSDEKLKYPYQTSWGLTTRIIGAIIMAHGDERGLRLPPNVAPVQVVLVPIAAHKNPEVVNKCNEIAAQLKAEGIRTTVDNSDNAPGWKFNEWEVKGVPVRIEIGPKDLENKACMIFRRDKKTKETVELLNVVNYVKTLLSDINTELYNEAYEIMQGRIKKVDSYDELKDAINNQKVAFAPFCCTEECEKKVKTEMSATVRCIPEAQTLNVKHCVCCGKPCNSDVYIARSY